MPRIVQIFQIIIFLLRSELEITEIFPRQVLILVFPILNNLLYTAPPAFSRLVRDPKNTCTCFTVDVPVRKSHFTISICLMLSRITVTNHCSSSRQKDISRKYSQPLILIVYNYTKIFHFTYFDPLKKYVSPFLRRVSAASMLSSSPTQPSLILIALVAPDL